MYLSINSVSSTWAQLYVYDPTSKTEPEALGTFELQWTYGFYGKFVIRFILT